VLIVAALGGNALLRRGEAPTAEAQRRNVRIAAEALAGLAAGRDLVVCHGNGPQVGLLALQALAYAAVPPYPLDVLGAESEGMIGYVIEQELAAVLPGRPVAALLTQVEVDPADPAFARPSKPIGPLYPAEEAGRLARERGWTMMRDGAGCRRAVPSPEPRRILELPTIALLVRAGVAVVCAGGGGIPVVVSGEGRVRGVEAVIDKDRTAALLAAALGADALAILTDVDAVYADWEGERRMAIRAAPPRALAAFAFAPGSMGPKVEAAARFASATGKPAVIGALADARALLDGRRGTTIAQGEPALRWW
jgi:carbamate kinase